MSNVKFYFCDKCKNIVAGVTAITDGVEHEIKCCGQPMQPLQPNVTEAAVEKHMPVVTVNGNTVTANIGEVTHPMQEEHLIQWICLETTNGYQMKYLKAGDNPEVSFVLGDEKPVAVYEYCNLHGLWMHKI